ncbi:UPF0606 protein KIAA1549-like isoform X2 [Anguilla rostrata]|uniref:UPF0606 protein KIAA1549-like isoform X2 n=1 Tax=Anguilla rostrata TaxID=7938 RepID=UPI0030CC0A87
MEMTTDSKVFPRTPLRLRCCYALLILGSMVLVSMTTASPPQTDARPLASGEPEGAVATALRTEAPIGSARAGASGRAGLPAQTDPPSSSSSSRPPQPGFVGNRGDGAGGPALANLGPSVPSAGPLPTPPLGSAGSEGGPGGSPETPLGRTWTPHPNPSSPAPRDAPSSGPDSAAAAGRPPDAPAANFGTPPSRTARSAATPHPPLTPSGGQRGTVTSAPPGEGAGTEESAGHAFPGTAGGPLPGDDPALSDAAHGIHLLLNPPEVPAPSPGPFAGPPPRATGRPAPGPTLAPEPEELRPSRASAEDDDWGSGDYLETMSFPGGPEGEEFPPATSLPADAYDQEDWSTEAYDTSFPTRAVPPLSSMRVSASPPAFTAAYGRPPPSVPPRGGPDEGSEPDWPDAYTAEPTEVLLPDMNSLEYYTTLLAKENASAAQRNLTSPRPAPPRPPPSPSSSPPTPHIRPTGSLGLAPPTASANGSGGAAEEESAGDESGSGSPARPVPNGSEPALEPSVAPAPSMTLSASLWGGQVSAAPTPSPGETSSSASSQRPDGGWIISPTSVETALRPTASVATHATPALGASSLSPAGASSPPPPPVDQGAATTGADRRGTTGKNGESPSASSPGRTTPLTTTTGGPLVVTPKAPLSSPPRQYLCNVTKLETYSVKVDLPPGSTVGFAKALIREVLKGEFNRSVELQVLKSPSDFVFRAVSGSVVYTAIAVINAIRQSARISSAGLAAMPVVAVPDYKFQVHSVLQFVPSHVDVRVCSFGERVERGLTMAYAEVRRRSNESTNFSVHILNVTTSAPRAQRQQRAPVDITFAVRDGGGGGGGDYLRGSDVSAHLRLLNMVEFSFYLGFPVLQIAEPFHYPELNVTQLLRSSWVRTVLLGVLDQRVNERTFQAKMERRLAQLLGEVLGLARRWKRATSVGNNSVQIVRTSRLEGPDYPLEMVYFVEGPGGERVPAVATSAMLNQLDVQRAAIVLGYRVQGVLAQPVEKLAAPPSETQSNNMWIIVGVVVPVLVVVVIIIILYWKMCRTDKLEFQPDAMATVQQRQKLQAPSVKGFDFAKLHLGQHSKDDIMVIQEPAPLPAPVKEVTPSENGDVPTPKSKTSSTKASRAARRRGRISPSDGDSLASDPSSGRESTEENLRAPAPPGEGKQARKNAKNGPPPANGADEQLSSASIFEHVDRMTRSGDGTRRAANKIQLIAMQPMPAPPQHSPAVTERVSESAKINKEVALRHKSEIEHHRNKIRLRAKRRGHYDFPAMDDIMDSFGDLKDPEQIYQKAQMQIDKILDPDAHVPSIFMEPRKSARGRRSPKQRKKPQVNGTAVEDKDRLITTDSDGTYRKYPGVNNVAYVVGGPAHASKYSRRMRLNTAGACV